MGSYIQIAQLQRYQHMADSKTFLMNAWYSFLGVTGHNLSNQPFTVFLYNIYWLLLFKCYIFTAEIKSSVEGGKQQVSSLPASFPSPESSQILTFLLKKIVHSLGCLTLSM